MTGSASTALDVVSSEHEGAFSGVRGVLGGEGWGRQVGIDRNMSGYVGPSADL